MLKKRGIRKYVAWLMLGVMVTGLTACHRQENEAASRSQDMAASSMTTMTSSSDTSSGEQATSRANQSVHMALAGALGQPFDDLAGQPHQFADYQGKKVYIKFWASWCSICLAGLEEVDELAGEQEDFQVVSMVAPGLGNEKSLEDFKTWYASLQLQHLPVWVDRSAHLMKELGVVAFPTSVFLNSKGEIVKTQVGHLSKEQIKALMAEID